MSMLCSRFAVRAAMCMLIPLAGLSCDVLNPTFVNDLGGNVTPSTPDPTGNIVVIFNNMSNSTLTLSYTFDRTLPGGETRTESGGMTNYGGYPFMSTHDCSVTKIVFTGISSGAATTQPTDTTTTEGGFTATFTTPSLQCGSVVFVNVPITGTPTAAIVP